MLASLPVTNATAGRRWARVCTAGFRPRYLCLKKKGASFKEDRKRWLRRPLIDLQSKSGMTGSRASQGVMLYLPVIRIQFDGLVDKKKTSTFANLGDSYRGLALSCLRQRQAGN